MWNVPCKFQLVVGDEGFGTFRRWSFFAGNESLRADLESYQSCHFFLALCFLNPDAMWPASLLLLPSLSVAMSSLPWEAVSIRKCKSTSTLSSLSCFLVGVFYHSNWKALTYHNGNSEWQQQHAKWLFASVFFSLPRYEPPNQGCSFRSPWSSCWKHSNSF